MSHKVHPKAYRLKELADWGSRWFDEKKFSECLEEDFRIREFLKKKLKEAGVQDIEIERFSNKVNVIINTTRPGLIIGRGGKGSEDLKKGLEEAIAKTLKKKELKIEIKEIKDPWSNAGFVSQWIAQRIEKRMDHRKVMKQVLEKVMFSQSVKGARVEVAGRLRGAEIARREWLKKGSLPRQTIRADIDYGFNEAHCSYGLIGVKVWIYKGEKFT